MRISRVSVLLCLVIGLALCSSCGRQVSPTQPAPTQPASPAFAGQYFGKQPPGMTPQTFAPEVFREEVHSAPVFSPDGHEVCWSAMNDSGYVLYYSKLENGSWTKPAVPAFSHGDDCPMFSPDGKRLYFLRLDGNTQDIWFVEKTNEGWSAPAKLPDTVNSLAIHWQFSIASNGDLYFAGRRSNEEDVHDIYRAELVDGQYAKASKVEGNISSNILEYCPFIAKDGSYLLFSRTSSDQSYADLFVSFKGEDGSWGKAIKFDGSVNGSSHELCPWVSDDGKYLFFISTRSDSSRPYWVDAQVIEVLRPN